MHSVCKMHPMKSAENEIRPSPSRRRSSSSSNKRDHQGQDEQPEYINVQSLEGLKRDKLVVVDDHRRYPDNRANRRRTIGPDARYNDDFDFGKAQAAFSNDPVLNEQYGQLLDIQYQSNRRKSSLEMQLEIKAKSSGKSKPRRLLRDEGRSITWHSDRFKETLNDVVASPTSTKHLVQDRLKQFQNVDEVVEDVKLESKKLIERQRKEREKFFTQSGNDEEDQVEESKERKRSVKDLLSDFERKSKELIINQQNEQNDDHRRVCSDTETMMYDDDDEDCNNQYVEMTPKSKVTPMRDVMASKACQTPNQEADNSRYEQYLPGTPSPVKAARNNATEDLKNQTPTLTGVFQNLQPASSNFIIDLPNESPVTGKYLPMIPSTQSDQPKNLTDHDRGDENSGYEEYLPEAPSPVKMPQLVKRTAAEPRNSAMENQNLTLPTAFRNMHLTNSKFVIDLPIESPMSGQYLPMTPSTEPVQPKALLDHQRTPSQTLIMDHLRKEISFSPEETYVVEQQQQQQQSNSRVLPLPEESPRYCEIEEPPLIQDQNTSHYEHLCQMRSATPLHYEEIPEQNLPDIVGNTPTNCRNSSSDEDNNSKSASVMSDSFKPASFFLNNSPLKSNHQQQQIDGGFRGSVSSIESSASKRKSSLHNIQEVSVTMERRESKKHIPYYVSDLNEIEDATTLERAKAIQRLQSDMELLDAETEAHLRASKPKETHLIPRRAASSLDDLLCDTPANPRDLVTVHLPARGRNPPPVPKDVPPLDLTREMLSPRPNEADDDEEEWKNSLRRASSSHISGYVWDERDQKFLKLRSNQQGQEPNAKVLSPTFLGEGLLSPTVINNDQVGLRGLASDFKKDDENEHLSTNCTTTSIALNNLEHPGKD